MSLFRTKKKPATPTGARGRRPNPLYARQRRYERKKAAEGADIGQIPPVGNPTEREACRMDLYRFLTVYFPASTGLSPFSDDHRRVIERIQRCILNGGRFVEALPRGFCKTTITENAALWAVLYGHRRFVAIFGASGGAADGNIDSIKLELSENDLLSRDFPEVCHPIRALEGKPQRCASQTYDGRLTHVEWTSETIVLPQIAGSAAAGGIITAHGITAASRGMKHKRPDGVQQRPDFALLDDVQTDESAGTPGQVAKRLSLIKKNILKLGGHSRQIACVLNATVIKPDDLVEQLLDPKRNPAWQGERVKMVRKWADAHETLWLAEYARLRTTYDANQIGDQERAHRDATEFYRRNRAAMDAGGEVSWSNCLDRTTELSALQHAVNLLVDDGPEVFASECQNEPLEAKPDTTLLTAAEIAAKVNGVPRGIVPHECEYLTAFVDVQGEVLYWLVAAWAQNFTGYVIDYGAFPDQPAAYFTMSGAKKTLSDAIPGSGFEGRIHGGLEKVADMLLDREWRREVDQAPMRIGQCLVDANWGKSTSTVNAFCRRSKFAATLLPSHGRGVGPSSMPWENYTKREGARLGYHWMIPGLKDKPGATRHVIFDTNFYKTFVHERLAVRTGDRGCLSLFEERPEAHRMLADHWRAEYRVETFGNGRKVDVWKPKPGQDNHFFDCVVGATVAASMLGATLDEVKRESRPRKRVKFSDLQKGRA